MAPNDVVRKNIHVPPRLDFTGPVEPMPLPILESEAPRFPSASPPVDTEIDPLTIDTPPYRSVGKMNMKYYPSAPLKAASGWVVAPRAFITAGHCVYWPDFSGWVYEAVFCPRFDLACSAKEYVVEAVFTLRGWLDSPNNNGRRYDIAACLVTEAFGSAEPPLRFEISPLPALRFAALGYPMTPNSTHQFNGKRMWKSDGASIEIKDSLHYAENDLTGGASGGPWCEPDNEWRVSGLTAARLGKDPNVAASPVFDQGFQNLYDAVKNL